MENDKGIIRGASVWNKLSGITVWAIAFAFVEAAVVVYLRKLFHPQGFAFPLEAQPFGLILGVEVAREAATMVMLASCAWLADRRMWVRFGLLMVAFGVWDIFYYVWLWVILGWPPSPATLDILFLIPIAGSARFGHLAWSRWDLSERVLPWHSASTGEMNSPSDLGGGRPSSSRPFSLSPLSSGWDRRPCEGRCREHFPGLFSRRVWPLAWGVLRGPGGGAGFLEKLKVRKEKKCLMTRNFSAKKEYLLKDPSFLISHSHICLNSNSTA